MISHSPTPTDYDSTSHFHVRGPSGALERSADIPKWTRAAGRGALGGEEEGIELLNFWIDRDTLIYDRLSLHATPGTLRAARGSHAAAIHSIQLGISHITAL